LQKSPKGFAGRNLCCAVLSTGIAAQQALETRSIKSTPAPFVRRLFAPFVLTPAPFVLRLFPKPCAIIPPPW